MVGINDDVGICPICGETLKLYVNEVMKKEPIEQKEFVRIYCSNPKCRIRRLFGKLDNKGFCFEIWAGKKKLIFVLNEKKDTWQRVRIIKN